MKINYIKTFNASSGLVIIPTLSSQDIAFEKIKPDPKLFSGKKDSHYIIEKSGVFYLFLGIGVPETKLIKTALRRVAHKHASLLRAKTTLVIPPFFLSEEIEASVSGLLLGTYQLGHYKNGKEPHPIADPKFVLEILSDYKEVKKAAERGVKIGNAQLETLKMVDLPSNKVTPKYLSNWAFEAGKKYNFSVTVFDREQSKEMGLQAFLAVGQGSVQEPQFIVMDYHPKKAKRHIGLVGKGITFDTGGLNIKVAGMVHMKCDMAGAGAVLGAMQLIADLKLPYRVTAVVPACENVVDANSFVPSDVIQSYHGSSIEIIDTDAEGRLILADGLSYLIKNFNPHTVIDIATLTGNAVAALGYECCALFTKSALLAAQFQSAGELTDEFCWRMPLWDAYKSDIESEIADVKNFSGKPVAGAISAAKFLEHFTDDHASWAHLDIAGVAFVDDEFAKTKHSSAFGVHLITSFIENL